MVETLRSPHVITRYHMRRSQVSTILRHNLLQTFQKKFIASTCDVRPPVHFQVFPTPFAFYIFLNQISRNMVAMSRARDGGVFTSVPGYGIEIPSEE
jgi:hypothetical protein